MRSTIGNWFISYIICIVIITDGDARRANRSSDSIQVNRRTLEHEGDKEEDIKMGVVSIFNICYMYCCVTSLDLGLTIGK